MAPHPLTNFEIQKYYQNKLKINGIYSRNSLPKIKELFPEQVGNCGKKSISTL